MMQATSISELPLTLLFIPDSLIRNYDGAYRSSMISNLLSF